jgi:hypothetical protein
VTSFTNLTLNWNKKKSIQLVTKTNTGL